MLTYNAISPLRGRCVNVQCDLSTEGAGVLTYKALSPLRGRCVNVQCTFSTEGAGVLPYNAISPLTPNHSKNLVHDLKKNLTKRENRADWQAPVDVMFNKTKQTVFDQRPQSFVSLFVFVLLLLLFCFDYVSRRWKR